MDKNQDIISQKITFINRISVRISIIILAVLVLGIGTAAFYFIQMQNSTILQSREKAIKEESEVIYLAIKNNMLAGEARIAVDLFKDFASSVFVDDIKLYRTTGVTAFSDNSTLETVNNILNDKKFTPKTKFILKEKIENKDFAKTVKTIDEVFVKDIKSENKQLIIYQPLINQPRCSTCHGTGHVLRGVLRIASSINEPYRQARQNSLFSIGIYSVVIFVLTILIILFINKVIINKILNIGDVVMSVGEGNFDSKVSIKENNEIGLLAKRINKMIDGLRERFRLTKFVSRSTLEHVKADNEILLGGEKKVITVLFTDIRGFTHFSEKRDPSDVMKILNKVMKLQSKIINQFDGDIDKFVGDEIMAIFEGQDMVLRAAKAAEKIKKELILSIDEDIKTIAVGIGINTGEVISGNMGGERRLDRTVLGDTVNIGARLCSAAGRNVIVLSEYSYNEIKEFVSVTEHNPIKVKGKDKPLKIYTLKETL